MEQFVDGQVEVEHEVTQKKPGRWVREWVRDKQRGQRKRSRGTIRDTCSTRWMVKPKGRWTGFENCEQTTRIELYTLISRSSDKGAASDMPNPKHHLSCPCHVMCSHSRLLCSCCHAHGFRNVYSPPTMLLLQPGGHGPIT